MTVRTMLPVLLSLAAIGGCTATNSGNGEAKPTATIEYQVEGTVTAAITYSTWSAGKLDATTVPDVPLPWKQTIDATGLTQDVALMASTGQHDGEVTCRVVKGGKVLAETKASGVLAVASCTATP